MVMGAVGGVADGLLVCGRVLEEGLGVVLAQFVLVHML